MRGLSRRTAGALALAAALLAAPTAPAQQAPPATLVADRVRVLGEDALIAEGNVEVISDGTRLTASAIRYDRADDVVTISGPIRVDDGAGAVIVADAAALDQDLTDGLLIGARLVLDRQLQVAAAEIARAGPITQARRAVASSCRVCAESPVPTWEIRAREITVDEARERLTFEGAQFRVGGVPILALPRITVPTPGVERAPGFLVPSLRSTSTLGTGVIAPYFVPLGPSQDLTFSPYVSSRTTTMGLRYRRAFRRGDVELGGALTSDDVEDEDRGLRGHGYADGTLFLPRDTVLSFELLGSSDDEYLLDYGISDDDRLRNEVSLSRASGDDFAEARIVAYQDLRGQGLAETSPRVIPGFQWERRLTPAGLGIIDLSVSGDGYTRDATRPIDTDVDADAIADGRDAARIGASASWRLAGVLPGGVLAGARAGLDAQVFEVGDDAAFEAADGPIERVLPEALAELRWPLRRVAASGTVDVLEPKAALAWSPDDEDRPPPEDSTRVELDAANLLAASRFPGEDAVERGTRAGLGVSWRRHMPSGWRAGATVGRVVRAEADPRLAEGTGLHGTTSDWLLEADLDTGAGVALAGRSLLGEGGASRSEALLRLASRRLTLDAGYAFSDEVTGPDGIARDVISQLLVDADARLTTRWSTSLGLRYDFEAERAQTALVGLIWRNECAQVDLSLERRFEDESSLDPETRFGFAVALLGFGDREASPARSTCEPRVR